MNTSTVIITSVGLFLGTSVDSDWNECSFPVGTCVVFDWNLCQFPVGTGVDSDWNVCRFFLDSVSDFFGMSVVFYWTQCRKFLDRLLFSMLYPIPRIKGIRTMAAEE